MIELCPNGIRKIFIPGAFFFLGLIAVSIHSKEAEILLSPPGLRLIKDPSLVIPADSRYPNRLIKLPVYHDTSKNPLNGWEAKFVNTRRFASDQSAWIYFRSSDLQRSIALPADGDHGALRFWPVGTIVVIEIYEGDAVLKENNKLIEIAAMLKTNPDRNSYSREFYPADWIYARFTPDGTYSITSEKVGECHQCHSIAFHLTGDLIFTEFP